MNELPDGADRNPIRRNYYGTNCRIVQSGTQLGGLLLNELPDGAVTNQGGRVIATMD